MVGLPYFLKYFGGRFSLRSVVSTLAWLIGFTCNFPALKAAFAAVNIISPNSVSVSGKWLVALTSLLSQSSSVSPAQVVCYREDLIIIRRGRDLKIGI